MAEVYRGHNIAERDWKHFRVLHKVALERFCKRVLEEASAVTGGGGEGFHERYLRLWKLLGRRNKEMAWAFDDIRRSTAYERLAAMKVLGAITDEELSQFSEQTQGTVKTWAECMRGDLEEEEEGAQKRDGD